MKYQLRDAQLIFMEGTSVIEIETVGTDPIAPTPPIHRCGGLDCLDCWNRAMRQLDWDKQRRLESL